MFCASHPDGRTRGGWWVSARLLLSALVLLQGLGGAAPACTTCSAPSPTLDGGSEENFLIEAAKKQILSKLHLRERPNITHTVPRAALATALRKLHAGRVRPDGTIELENGGASARLNDQAYEIVSFADTGKSRPPKFTTHSHSLFRSWGPTCLSRSRRRGCWSRLDETGGSPRLELFFTWSGFPHSEISQSGHSINANMCGLILNFINVFIKCSSKTCHN